ncbi:hypothetical protein BDY21DRAFT_368659 [Lineolata rhizophorae]|uniref:Eukaryotic translation initiation factor 3 subunit A n=1 Tax=Lineolata rhizophorae TaxID=578093 RepID=A0A6A6PBS5_9PEZI|nr:hypothetical protein BDY21DRAFT_368659 [Lineolata rhizophorae]
MPPPPHSKPENILKRAEELINVGQSPAALSLLHEHVVSKRSRNSPITSLEPVMLKFVELCVELRKGKLAKDGLYQYKNTAQNTNVGTIEAVFNKFTELARQKVTEAQARAEEVQSTIESSAPANVEDLEASETPESILLSTVSGEQSKDRTDRAIVTPWLKFLWETYRTVLDIFKNNARLETMYQRTAHEAFEFCSKYARKTEFRRLCELLRNHLQNAAKFSSQMHAINLSDPDTLQRHLDTRFQQLNVAVELELWQEAFRSVEDIHTLLNLSKRPAKNIMMANYFEKLTRIFLVSENYLFHAAAWSRYYNLLRQSAAAVASGQSHKRDNPAVTDADMTKAASFVILSALAIPVISTSRSRGAMVDVDEAKKSKNVRLTNLLGMTTAPTRAILFKDALNKSLLRRCRPEIRELYNILEVDFHPLSICKKISPILAQIGADPEMQKYIVPLQQVILTRLFQQLSQVYESVELKFVLDLAQFPDPFKVSSGMIEKFIMNGCKKGDLAIRIDHAAGVLTFDSDVFSSARALHPGTHAGSAEAETGTVQRLQSTPAEIVRTQLTRLAKSLFITCQYVDPSFNEERLAAKAAALERTKEGADKERQETLARRDVIERKKQAASTALAQKEKEEANRKRIRAQQLQDMETQRRAEEQRERELRRLKMEQQRVQREEIEKQLNEIKHGIKGIDISSLDPSELDSHRIRALKLAALEREKNELGERLRVTGKRIDHLERAFRREEVKHLHEDYARQKEADSAAYDKMKAETLKEAERKHKEDVALKHRLSRLVPVYENFRDTVREQRKAEFDKRKKAAERELQQKMDARRKEVRNARAREQREREERERLQREEEERIAREEEEKARREEELRAKMAAEKAEREEKRRKLDEQAALQRKREEEAEAKLAARKQATTREPPRTLERPSPVAAPADAERPDSSGGSRPPTLHLAGDKKPLWREREAARLAAGNAPPPTPPTAAAAVEPPAAAPPTRRQGGGYVPPALRQSGGGEDRWRSRDGSGRSMGMERSSSGRGGFDRELPPARTQSPAAAGGSKPGPSVPAALRNRTMDGAGAGPRAAEERPPPPPQGASDGKYRPGAFAKRGQ